MQLKIYRFFSHTVVEHLMAILIFIYFSDIKEKWWIK